MPTDRRAPERALRRALAELARADAADLVTEARAGARVRAKAILEDALVDELISAAAAQGTDPRPETGPSGSVPPPEPAGLDEPDEQRPAGDAWWAYCVSRADDVEQIGELEGIEPGTRVETVVDGPVAGLVSRVPLEEYGDERLREHLEDITWLERAARAHETVLEQAMDAATIVPLRLCTLYRDPGGVRTALREHADELLENLEALTGRSEWGVKVFWQSRQSAESAASVGAQEPGRASSADPPSASDASSGRGYLATRQQQRRLADRLEEVCTACVADVHGSLSDLACQDRVNPVQRPEAHGRDAEMILNGAYLVDDNRREELRGAVDGLLERWEREGFHVELTGPWPPYNFVSDTAGMIP